LNVVRLPMPVPVVHDGCRLPASYANFYIANTIVLVPTYRCSQDQNAIQILQEFFPERRVVGIDCTDIVLGLGALHCLTHEEVDV
ncbi:MAG: agmatine deiminase family protein, partial [Chlorobium sp.]